MAAARTDEALLRTFFMEEYLEAIRLERFNLGESGARSLTVSELLGGVGLGAEEISRTFVEMSLRNSPNWGRDDLRDAVAAMHPGATRNEVLVCTGTSEALLLLFRQLRPKKVALVMPAFQTLYEVPAAMGAEIVSLPVEWDDAGRPTANWDAWLATLRSSKPDCIVLNTPHNPSGLVFDGPRYQEVLDFARDSGAWVIADEHYRFHANDDRLLGDTLYKPEPRLFVTGSFIKCYGCTGLRIGWAVGPHDVLAALQNDKNYITHTVSPVSEWIGYELMKTIDTPILRQLRAEWMENKRQLAAFLASSKHWVGAAPTGGFVTSVTVRGVRERAQLERVRSELAERKVFMLPLELMEAHTAASAAAPSSITAGLAFRLGLGLTPPDFAEALQRLEDGAKAAAIGG